MYTSISVPKIILKEVVKMNYVLLVILLIIAITFAGFITNWYMGIQNKKLKTVLVIVFWIILIICIIVLVTFLFDFFKILAQMQPI